MYLIILYFTLGFLTFIVVHRFMGRSWKLTVAGGIVCGFLTVISQYLSMNN